MNIAKQKMTLLESIAFRDSNTAKQLKPCRRVKTPVP